MSEPGDNIQPEWRIYGPLSRLAELDPASPSTEAPNEARSLLLPFELRPAEPEREIFYALLQVGAQGHELSHRLRFVRTSRLDGQALTPPLLPVWPDIERWPVAVEAGRLTLRILWERPLRLAGVQTLELQAQINGGAVQTLETLTPDLAHDQFELTRAVPDSPTRWRWRLISPSGAAVVTEWSAVVLPPTSPWISLQILEPQS